MSKTIFSVLFFLLLQTCGIIYKTCNAGNSEQYQNCITQLQKELSNRIGENDILADAGTILEKIIENKTILEENKFSKNIIQYIEKYRTRLDSIIKHHTIHLKKNNEIHSNSQIKHTGLPKDQFWREFNKESWMITRDYRQLEVKQLNPKSTRNGRHKYYYSTDATILLYALKSLHKGFFGDRPKKIEIKEIEEHSTVHFFRQKPQERKNFYTETKFGKNIKRLEHEIGLKVDKKYQVFDKQSFNNYFSLHFDVEKNLSTQRQPEAEDNKDSIFRIFFSYFWR